MSPTRIQEVLSQLIEEMGDEARISTNGEAVPDLILMNCFDLCNSGLILYAPA